MSAFSKATILPRKATAPRWNGMLLLLSPTVMLDPVEGMTLLPDEKSSPEDSTSC